MNQAIVIMGSWDRQTMPISHPYVTASVNLTPNPLQRQGGQNIIKSQCNNVFCSYDKLKYNHEFYLCYSDDTKRWTKTLPNIKNGNMRVHISGLYMGCFPKDEDNQDNVFHAIQITELDFETKVSRVTIDEDDDDELFFGSFTPKKSSSKNNKKHDLTRSESSADSSDKSSSSNATQNKKKKKASKKQKTTSATDKVDESTTKIKHEVPYEKLPATKAIASLNDNQSSQYNPYFNNPKNIPPLNDSQYNPYYHYPPYPYYPPPSSQNTSTSEKANDKTDSDKKSVQFDLNNEQDIEPVEKKGKRGAKSKRGRKSKATPTRTSPRKKGGILNMAVNKVANDDDNDDDDDTHSKKSESLMDTESDYHTQNEEMNDNFEDDGSD